MSIECWNDIDVCCVLCCLFPIDWGENSVRPPPLRCGKSSKRDLPVLTISATFMVELGLILNFYDLNLLNLRHFWIIKANNAYSGDFNYQNMEVYGKNRNIIW